eukprot:IDg4471t1
MPKRRPRRIRAYPCRTVICCVFLRRYESRSVTTRCGSVTVCCRVAKSLLHLSNRVSWGCGGGDDDGHKFLWKLCDEHASIYYSTNTECRRLHKFGLEDGDEAQ